MATLPPWLQINPEQFTQAAIAGGEQGYRAASEAGSLAQRGLLSAVQLAQESAKAAQDIAVRREAINAELAKNAANVAAARYNAALDNSIQQQNVDLMRQHQADAVAQEQAKEAAAVVAQDKALAGAKDVAGIRANAPREFAQSEWTRRANEAVELEKAGRVEEAKQLRDYNAKLATQHESENPDRAKSEFDRFVSKVLANNKLDAREKRHMIEAYKAQTGFVDSTAAPVAAPAAPASAVGAPYRYVLKDGQYQLTQ